MSNTDQVLCIIAPIKTGTILLPCQAIAEVLGGEDLQRKLSSDAMMVRSHVCGVLNWREQAVAIYAYEAIIGAQVRAANLNFSYCAVIKPYEASSGGYVAIALQAMPELRCVRRGDLWLQGGTSHVLVVGYGEFAGKKVLIPNLPVLAKNRASAQVLENQDVFA